jgi:serine/threonine protein kinase
VDARTDVYAVGVLLYAMLTGAGPFDHIKGALQLLQAHANEVPPAPSTRTPAPIPRELDEAVMRALAKAPDERFPNASMFSAVLARIAHQLGAPTATPRRFGTEVVAPSPGTPPPSPLYAPNAPAAPPTPTARRFGTEVVAPTPGTPPPSPVYAPSPRAQVAAARPIVLMVPGAPPPVLAPEAQTVAELRVPARRHRYGTIIATLGALALALLALAVLAARGWTAR